VASAYDDDPGYGQFRPWYGGNADRSYRPEGGVERDRRNEPIYYRPTMRYYGKGYTVSYRYMPVYWYENGYGNQNVSSNFRTEDFRISTQDIAAWGAKPPRLVVPNKKTPSQSAVTSIVRSKPVYSSPVNVPTNVPTPGAPLPVPTAPLPTPTIDPSAPVPGVSDAPKP
jgi:hypothetical protein